MKPDALIARPEGGALTPARVSDLIEIAVKQGGDPGAVAAAIKELANVAERAADRQAKSEFDAAYFAFREECPNVPRTKQGAAGAGYSWWYAPYERIRGVVDPLLRKHGLSIRESSEETDGAIRAVVEVRHVGGHAEQSTFTVRKGSANPKLSAGQQDAGTLTTALRRALAMALGIVTSDPEDGEPPGEAQRVTEAQVRELEDLFTALDASEESRRRFRDRFKVKHLDELHPAAFPVALADLKALVAKKRGAQ